MSLKLLLFLMAILYNQLCYCMELSDKLVILNTRLNQLLQQLSFQKIPERQNLPDSTIWRQLAQAQQLTRADKIKLFISDTLANTQENNKIPAHAKNDTTLRIATYNVHYWTDPNENSNFEEIMATIGNINADVVLLQEVSLGNTLFQPNTKEQLIARFKKNYPYTNENSFCLAANLYSAPFGNMILSKFPLSNVETYIYKANFGSEKRCFVRATLQLPHNKQISVYVTHLDVFDNTGNTRLMQAKELIDIIKNDRHSKNILLAGDFNSVRESDYEYQLNNKLVWDLLVADNARRHEPTPTNTLAWIGNEFTDSFSLLGISGPKFTVWSGTVIDFIFFRHGWQTASLPILNSYVYFSPASDHLPIVVDIEIK